MNELSKNDFYEIVLVVNNPIVLLRILELKFELNSFDTYSKSLRF